jgi:transglutaminase-like putative cysteine protease
VTGLPSPADCLLPGRFIDSNHPAIIATARSLADPAGDELKTAVALYYLVRDSIRYNPYRVDTFPAAYLASATLAAAEGWCVTKALLLAALCRAAGVPSRVGYADVRNHLSTERLRQAMQTDVFYFHGYTSIYLGGRWVKATPAFNIELCQKFGLAPLEFNGLEDSLYHPFDLAGNRHMEYLNERGDYFDLPFEELMEAMRAHYPRMFGTDAAGAVPDASSWAAEVEAEVSR